MKFIVWMVLSFVFPLSITAQGIYSTKKGRVSFYSKAPLENIEAHNDEAAGFIDSGNGDVAFSVLIKSFKFEKALMQEHFNTSYMESDKFPKATFLGKIKDPGTVQWNVNGTYQVTVEGTLTIHNVSKPLATGATITIKDGIVSSNARFNVHVADFAIKVPSVVSQNIAETVEVTVDCRYAPLQNPQK